MGIYPWTVTKTREALKKQIMESPDASTKDFAEIIEEALTDWYKVHGKGNPAFRLDQFNDPSFLALPTIAQVIPREKADLMDVDTLVEIAKNGKARTEEAIAALRRKGFTSWDLEHLK